MNDLRIDGFMLKGVRTTYSNKFTPNTLSEGIYTVTFDRSCDIEKFFLTTLDFQ